MGVLYGLAMGLSAAAFKISPARFFGRAHLGAIQGVLQTTRTLTTLTLTRTTLTLRILALPLRPYPQP